MPKSLRGSDFGDFLKKCLLKDERDRWSADRLLGHSWIKHRMDHIQSPIRDDQNAPENADHGRKESPSSEVKENENEEPLPFYWISSSAQSRLQSEFSFLCNLGKGGFG